MKKQILVVDDTKFYLNLMSRILSKGGHRVVTAQDGFQALNILSSFVPDIMFVDMIMPKIQGDKLCQLVRKMPHMRHCYIVVVSAAIREMDFDFQKIGADACIVKKSPKDLADDMAEAIRTADALERDRAAAAAADGEEIEARRPSPGPTIDGDHMMMVLEKISSGILGIREGLVTYTNAQAISFLEKSAEEMMGIPYLDLFPESIRAVLRETVPSAGELSEMVLKEPVSLNGRQILVKVVTDHKPAATGAVILADVGKQKEVERALNESIVYSESIIASMADALIVLNTDLRINLANRAACNLLKYTEHELFDMSIDDIIETEEGFERTLLRDLVRRGTVRKQNLTYTTKTGEQIPVSFLGTMLDYESGGIRNPGAVICIAHDMREILELQTQVLQSEKMAATGLLSAGVAHEIKNPLAIIVQGVEALEFAVASTCDLSTMRDMIQRIKHAATRADAIVKGLLDFSRQSPTRYAAHDTSSVVDEALALVESQIRLQNIRITRRYSSKTPRIKVDKTQIQQVIINLLVNAVEAMPNGGAITIRTRPNEEKSGGPFVQLTFSDTGCGIPEDQVEKVWEPFFTTKSQALNTGLGLSISQGIIEKHKGAMHIHSTVNKGTHITIDLPGG